MCTTAVGAGRRVAVGLGDNASSGMVTGVAVAVRALGGSGVAVPVVAATAVA